MIERGYLRIAGPTGVGKTTLAEAVLRAFDGPTIAVRCERDDRLAEVEESKGARDPELRRYREAGASGAARLRFPTDDRGGDSFFCSDVMNDYSKAVIIEGECPVEYVDLEVFVAPPLAPGGSLLRRRKRRSPEAASSALEEVLLGLGDRAAIAAFAGAPRGGSGTLWEIAPTHRGLERAGLVIVNVRSGDDRAAAERMLDEIARIRSDDDVRTSILGRFAHRTKVTAVAADLSDRTDAGTRKALARIKRALAHRGDRG